MNIAQVLLICIDLPRLIYPPNKSFIYHQRVAELLFGDQPILQTLALENALITISAGTGMNHIQRNVVREWLSRPVHRDHRVYSAAAQYLSEAETEAAAWSSVEQRRRPTVIPPGLAVGWNQLRRGFESAVKSRPQTKTHSHDSEERRPLFETEALSAYENQELFTLHDVSCVHTCPHHVSSSL